MKQKLFRGAVLLAILSWQACDTTGSRYVDLNTGEALMLEKDSTTGLLVNKATGKTVEMYVDTEKKDTIYGRTGKVVNGKVVKRENGKYVYLTTTDGNAEATNFSSGDDKVKQTNDEIKIKNGDYKKEIEKDGDITIKDGDTKIKIDGKTGERKVKKDD
jgi:hypothetical protein